MNDKFGGYTIRSNNRLFVPYSMAGYRTTVSPLEELHDDNNRWNIVFTSENTIRLSLGPNRMMKERYPTVNDHHIAPASLGDLYAT
jgi:nuclear transport factor 2 (NTF2) superfamily protein